MKHLLLFLLVSMFISACVNNNAAPYDKIWCDGYDYYTQGKVYKDKNDSAKANKYFRKALINCKLSVKNNEIMNPETNEITARVMADILLELKDYTEAKRYYLMALAKQKSNTKYSSDYLISGYYDKLNLCEQSLNNTNLAKVYAKKSALYNPYSTQSSTASNTTQNYTSTSNNTSSNNTHSSTTNHSNYNSYHSTSTQSYHSTSTYHPSTETYHSSSTYHPSTSTYHSTPTYHSSSSYHYTYHK